MNVFEYVVIRPLRNTVQSIRRAREDVDQLYRDQDLLHSLLSLMGGVTPASAYKHLHRVLERDKRVRYGSERYAAMLDAVDFLREYATSVQASSLLEDDPRAQVIMAAAKMLKGIADSEEKVRRQGEEKKG